MTFDLETKAYGQLEVHPDLEDFFETHQGKPKSQLNPVEGQQEPIELTYLGPRQNRQEALQLSQAQSPAATITVLGRFKVSAETPTAWITTPGSTTNLVAFLETNRVTRRNPASAPSYTPKAPSVHPWTAYQLLGRATTRAASPTPRIPTSPFRPPYIRPTVDHDSPNLVTDLLSRLLREGHLVPTSGLAADVLTFNRDSPCPQFVPRRHAHTGDRPCRRIYARGSARNPLPWKPYGLRRYAAAIHPLLYAVSFLCRL
jgi:hypothetical protein